MNVKTVNLGSGMHIDLMEKDIALDPVNVIPILSVNSAMRKELSLRAIVKQSSLFGDYIFTEFIILLSS